MGAKKERTKERLRLEAENAARASSIARARKAAKKALKEQRKAAKKAREEAGSTWSEDPRTLLRVGPETSYAEIDRTATPGYEGGAAAGVMALAQRGRHLADLQERLYASAKAGAVDSVLLIIQGLDTSGKGGVLRHVVGQVDPQGVAVTAFKAPTDEERAHDFLWRVRPRLPRPGYIGVFDRSHYEDLLVPTAQALTGRTDDQGRSWVVSEEEINRRYHDIYEMELSATQAGMRIIKVCLAISYEEQGRRLMERLERADKNWKFSVADLDTRDDWDHYQAAYAEVLGRTSTDIAPWYVIPADRKWYARLAVQEILARTLEDIDPRWPLPIFDVEAAKARLLLSMSPEANIAHR